MDGKYMINEKYSFKLSNYARDLMNKQTANEYYTRLSNFQKFLVSHYGNGINLDNFEDLKINLLVQVIIILG